MELEKKRLKISAHHGDLERPNNLEATRSVMERYGDEIDIYEIDFVSDGKRIISSHDYEVGKIMYGSRLEKWIKMVVVEKRKILWIDIKENLPIFFSCGYGKFNTTALFNTLNNARRKYAEFDIASYLWIGCQEPDLHDSIYERRGDWTVILDMPKVSNYIWQYIPLIPKGYLRDKVCDECHETEYEGYPIITIDQSFFFSVREIKTFIKSLSLPPEVIIVVNSFDRDVKPIEIDNHYIIMQYNYSC